MHCSSSPSMSYTLGISAFYHDSAAVLLKDDMIIAAFQEERFTRIKQDNRFPINAIKHCLKEANLSFEQVNLICYYENPHKKFKRIVKTYLRNFPKGSLSFIMALPHFIRKRNIIKIISKNLAEHFEGSYKKIIFSDHHLSHAASAFYASPFEQAAILCIDGVGEWATVSAWQGDQLTIKPLWQIDFPHSLGLLYSAFTQFCGFKVDSGEYKLMGLAPYGTPKYEDIILQHIINLNPDGTFTLNRKYFNYEVGNTMVSKHFNTLFGGKGRSPESKITQREMDLAASIQAVTEKVVFKLTRKLQQETQLANLCLAGGVALNCVANGKLLRSRLFDDIWIQPASGDAGGALGAAYIGYYQENPQPNKPFISKQTDAMRGGYLGNAYTNNEIKDALEKCKADYAYYDDHSLLPKTAEILKHEKVIGWFQGKMEFGPRALGSRSILGHPQAENMQSIMNLKIKNRESFRPFAPAILNEHTENWFQLGKPSPYMLLVAEVHDAHKKKDANSNDITSVIGLDKLKIVRSNIPAVTHVDFSARIQTVDGEFNPKFYQLLQHFYELTSCPILINTSFNVRGEPIVQSPLDAYRCFMRTAMDYLVIGNYLLEKQKQPDWIEQQNWRETYALD